LKYSYTFIDEIIILILFINGTDFQMRGVRPRSVW